MNFLTVRLESTQPNLFQHVPSMVYIRHNGGRKSYWCETGMFWPHEAKQAEEYARLLSRRGLKTYVISRTLT